MLRALLNRDGIMMHESAPAPRIAGAIRQTSVRFGRNLGPELAMRNGVVL
jgi:hypothetical protein